MLKTGKFKLGLYFFRKSKCESEILKAEEADTLENGRVTVKNFGSSDTQRLFDEEFESIAWVKV